MPEAQPSVGFLQKFTVVKGFSRELWITLAVKMLSYAAYAVTNFTLKRWLSTEYGYNDQQALAIVGAWSLAMTIVTLMVGSLTDAIGMRKAFFLGVWVCVVARVVMVFASAKWLVLAVGLFPLAVGEALGTPVLVAAVRKYSSIAQRSIAFSFAYALMNAGGWAAGKIFDVLRQKFGETGHAEVLGTTLTTYRALFFVSLGIEILILPLLWCIRKNAEVTDEGAIVTTAATRWSDMFTPLRKVKPMLSPQGRVGRGIFCAVLGGLILFNFLFARLGLSPATFKAFGDSGWQTTAGILYCLWLALCAWVVFVVSTRRWHDLGKPSAWALLSFVPGVNLIAILVLILKTGPESTNEYGDPPPQTGIDRLLMFLMLIAFLKLIFMQMYYVFPEFGIRELGEGAPVGQLWGINSGLIIVLVPLIGALTQRMSAYRAVVVGGIISSISVFIMALPTTWFQPMANGWFGSVIASYLGLTGPIHPYYPMITIFVILLSFGEAYYSPRVYEYSAAIAPKGQEGSYGALSYVPFLLAKLLIGTFSGTLLAKYCPAQGERHSEIMWLMVALTASIAPIGLIAMRKYIRVKEAGREA
jgi:MFS family permease